MFTASKLLDFLIEPLSWVLIILLIGLLVSLKPEETFGKTGGFNQNRLKTGYFWTALFILVFQSWEVIPDNLLRRLETQYSVPNLSEGNFEGIVVLGGALEGNDLWEGRTQPQLNASAERMTEALHLMQKNPKWKIIFTGGEGKLWGSGPSEAERASIFFKHMGLDDSRITYESKSRNTYENALLSTSLPSVNTQKKWLLLTSASHMPRAMATFKKVGWDVTAYPVDYSVGKITEWHHFSITGGAKKWSSAMHEWVGLLAYKLMGRA
mgnify:CR=1 FL=1